MAADLDVAAKRIGITGFRGFIGRSISSHLQRQGAHLRVLVRTPLTGGQPGLDIQQGDLLSQADCERFLDGLDTVFYLAHTNTPISSDRDLSNDALANTIPLLNFIQATRKMPHPPHVVYFSSGGGIYGRRESRRPFREEDPCWPQSSYGIQKLVAEHYLRAAADHGWITSTVLRIGNAYGTLLPTHRTQGLIGVILSRILAGQPAGIFGDPNNTRDYVHLDDLSCMCLRVAQPLATAYDVFNVGFGKGYSVRDVMRILDNCWGEPITWENLPGTEASLRLTDWVVLSVEKARQVLGWQPRIDLPEGIARLVRQIRTGRQDDL